MVIDQYPQSQKGQKEINPIITLEPADRIGWYKVKYDLDRDFPGEKSFDVKADAENFYQKLVEKEKEIIMAQEKTKEITVAQEIAEEKVDEGKAKTAGQEMWENGDIFVKGAEKPYINHVAWRKIYSGEKALTEKDLKTRPTDKQFKLAKSYGLRYNPNKVCAKQVGYALWKRSREPMTEKLKKALDNAKLEYTDETTLVQGYAALVRYRHEKANDTLRNKPATEKQKEFADTLGIEYPEDINAFDMSRKIFETRRQKVNKETMEEAQKEGMEVTPDSNQNTVELALAKVENEKIIAKDPVIKEQEKSITKTKTKTKANTKARSAKLMPTKDTDKDKQKQRGARQSG